MPTDVVQYLRFAIQFVHRFKWVFIALFYIALFTTLRHRAFVVLAPFILLSVLAYVLDKDREAKSMDDFSGGRLFFRYGEQVDRTALTLPVKPEWGVAETRQLPHLCELHWRNASPAGFPRIPCRCSGTSSSPIAALANRRSSCGFGFARASEAC